MVVKVVFCVFGCGSKGFGLVCVSLEPISNQPLTCFLLPSCRAIVAEKLHKYDQALKDSEFAIKVRQIRIPTLICIHAPCNRSLKVHRR